MFLTCIGNRIGKLSFASPPDPLGRHRATEAEAEAGVATGQVKHLRGTARVEAWNNRID